MNGLVLLTSPDFTRDVEASSFNRFYYHTLPVVLSAMEFGHVYDHTAKMSVRNAVWSIPINTNLDSVINQVQAIETPAPPDELWLNDQVYFWMVDDRGLADFTFIAFKLFGLQMASLGLLWYLVFFVGGLLGLLASWRSRSSLVLFLLYFTTCAILLPGIYRPTLDPMTGLDVIPVQHISDPRLSAILMIPFVMTIWVLSKRTRLGFGNAFIGLIASIFAWFIISIRSSNKTYLYALCFVVIVFFVVRSFLDMKLSKVSLYLLVMVLVVGGGFRHFYGQLEHPDYQSVGKRTVWHNAVMGLAYSSSLSQELGVTVSDHEALALVIAFQETGNLDIAARVVKADPEKYRALAQVALNWDPSTFDWQKLEASARSVMISVFREHPIASLKLFLLEKPNAYLQNIRQKTTSQLSLPFGLGDSIEAVYLISLVVGFFLGLRFFSEHLNLIFREHFLPTLCLTIVSVIPTVLFYINSGSFAEGLLFVNMLFFSLAALLGGKLRQVLESRDKLSDAYRET